MVCQNAAVPTSREVAGSLGTRRGEQAVARHGDACVVSGAAN